MDIYQSLPPNHFGKLMQNVLKELHAGESVCVLGMPGVGRTFFARQVDLLLRKEKWVDQVIYLEPLSLDTELIKFIKNQLLSLNAVNKKSFLLSLKKYLQNHRLVIIVDYLERAKNKKQLLDFLIDLRRLHITNVNILTTCNHTILSNPSEYFFRSEHFADSFYTLEPFNLNGVKNIVNQLKKFYLWKIDKSQAIKIYKLGGGSASLTKYLCKAVDVFGKEILLQTDRLIAYPPLRVRLEELFNALITESPEYLSQMHVVTNKKKPFAGLLTKYVNSFSLANLDIAFPDLTKLEKRILSFFVLNKDKIIDKNRIAFWMEMTDESYSLWAIYKILSRLRRKISGRYKLLSLKSKGYKLTEIYP